MNFSVCVISVNTCISCKFQIDCKYKISDGIPEENKSVGDLGVNKDVEIILREQDLDCINLLLMESFNYGCKFCAS